MAGSGSGSGSGSGCSEESEDDVSERCESYSYCLSADISESESSSLRFDLNTSPSSSSSPNPFLITGRDVLLPHSSSSSAAASEIELMKERFAKLLLGEDMSGGGKGVCTALAISNAITNLAATTFGELWRLEPLPPQRKTMWCREMEWLLCVTDSIVELVPSTQHLPCGASFEVMATRPRSDLYLNLPALKKLDAMLLSMLDAFQNTEFCYTDHHPDHHPTTTTTTTSSRPSFFHPDKWWLPSPKLPPNGLSDGARKRLQQCRDCTNQILKAAMSINNAVIAEMEIPCSYLQTLPKNGKDCLGELIYHHITAEQFSSECLLNSLDLSSEHLILDVANRIEAAVHIWRQKDKKKHQSHSRRKRSSWGGKVKSLIIDNEKNQDLAQRAMTVLRSLKLRFPALPQTSLDMSKIQYNKDVGQAILESYSRVMESLAFNIMARIDDVLYVDDEMKQSGLDKGGSVFCRGGLPIQKRLAPSPFSVQHSPFATPSLCFSPARGSKINLKASDDTLPDWSHLGNLNLSSCKLSGDFPSPNK